MRALLFSCPYAAKNKGIIKNSHRPRGGREMKLVIRNVETKISRIRYTLEKMVERDHPYAQKMKE
ncbi:hypothetical protein SDC9_123176 [bioreactor metagenome]|uniref:Uncharacterized protein n=1 Tax=bioreactor metagenome TaxID=1076179 RepID=A0A645CGV8_9ZZZZ